MNKTKLPPLDAVTEALGHIEKFIEGADRTTPEGVGELEVLCYMYAKGYMLKLRAMR